MTGKLKTSSPRFALGISPQRSCRLKKPRGCLRRAKRESQSLKGLPERLDEDDWFNYSHYHLDWYGRGNSSRQARECYLAGYARIFRHFEHLLPCLKHPFQIWIALNKTDSGQDAVFLHTPNPHSPFPANLTEIDWEVATTCLFDHLLPEFRIREGQTKSGLFFYAENVGVPIESAADK